MEKDLEKLNIFPKEKLTLDDKIYVSKGVSEMLSENINVLSSLYNEIYMRLFNCEMYYADIDEKFGLAVYYYKNNTIYLKNVDKENIISEQLVHECLHYLQNFSVVNNPKKNIRAGLCSFEEFRILGLGLNEAITQYITLKAMNRELRKINNEKIEIMTNSTSSYKYLASLAHQILFLMGENVAISSSINSNGEFEENLFNTFEENTEKILKNLDNLLEEKDNELTTIDLYLQTQELIYKTYFKKQYKLLDDKEEVDECVKKIGDYENLVGKTKYESIYNQNFKDFCKEMDEKFYKKYVDIDKKKAKQYLAVQSKNVFYRILERIRSFFTNKNPKNVNG